MAISFLLNWLFDLRSARRRKKSETQLERLMHDLRSKEGKLESLRAEQARARTPAEKGAIEIRMNHVSLDLKAIEKKLAVVGGSVEINLTEAATRQTNHLRQHGVPSSTKIDRLAADTQASLDDFVETLDAVRELGEIGVSPSLPPSTGLLMSAQNERSTTAQNFNMDRHVRWLPQAGEHQSDELQGEAQ